MTMTEATELKPCPFCGGEGEAWEDADPTYPWSITFKHDDECLLRWVPTDFFQAYKTEAEAIAAWNTRAITPSAVVTEATEVEVTQADRMLIEAIINDYHTTRLDSDYVSHILSKPRTQAAFARHRVRALPQAGASLTAAQKAGPVLLEALKDVEASRQSSVPVQGEPVAWMYKHPNSAVSRLHFTRCNVYACPPYTETPLYTHAPTERERVLLDVEQIVDVIGPFKFYVKQHEDYSGEHREWLKEYTAPKGAPLIRDIVSATLAAIAQAQEPE